MLRADSVDLSLYSLFEPELQADPYPFYQRLRTEAPVYWDSLMQSWVITRYKDVVAALHDPRLSEERISPFLDQLLEERRAKLAPLADVLLRMMLFQDPPGHTRLRGIVARAFTPRSMEAMRQSIQQLTDTLLDSVQDAVQVDLIHDFAAPLSAAVIANLLDVPEEHRHRFRNWESLLKDFFSQSMQGVENIVNLKKYFNDVVLKQQNLTEGSLLSVIMDAYNHKQLDVDDLFAIYVLIFDAGQVTTTNLIGNGMLALLRAPDQLSALRADPDLIVPAVNELLRYDGPVQFTTRIARDTFDVDGKRIMKGQSVTLSIGAANHDPAQFVNPDKLDITRQQNRHLGFGYGIHFCLGASLALIEAQIAISTLLRRRPTLRLVREPQWQENINFRFLETLLVASDT